MSPQDWLCVVAATVLVLYLLWLDVRRQRRVPPIRPPRPRRPGPVKAYRFFVSLNGEELPLSGLTMVLPRPGTTDVELELERAVWDDGRALLMEQLAPNALEGTFDDRVRSDMCVTLHDADGRVVRSWSIGVDQASVRAEPLVLDASSDKPVLERVRCSGAVLNVGRAA